MPAAPPESCTVPAVLGNPMARALTFRSAALNRLHLRHEWLNDECIDLGSEMLQRHFATNGSRVSPAIFSVFTIAQYLRGYDEALWRSALLTPEFWTKNVWMIPINREFNHWTLAIVYWRKKRIAYFDSFGSRSAWETDAPVTRMTYLTGIFTDPLPIACLRPGASPTSLRKSPWT